MRILVRLTVAVSVISSVCFGVPAAFYAVEAIRLDREADEPRSSLKKAEARKAAVEAGELKLDPGPPEEEPASKDPFSMRLYEWGKASREKMISDPVGYCDGLCDASRRRVLEAEGRAISASKRRDFYAVGFVVSAIAPWCVLALVAWIVFGTGAFQRSERETPSQKYQ